jgi:hypothetical protein
MEDPEEKIIVFRAYDTVMEANLAKTKLDAFGVPCFLTDENFTGFYPFRNNVFPGVRLHIFERDSDQVAEMLTDIPIVRRCPHCQSENIERDVSKNRSMNILTALTWGILTPGAMVFRCLACAREFDYPEYP